MSVIDFLGTAMRIYRILFMLCCINIAFQTSTYAAGLTPNEVKKLKHSIAFEYQQSLKACGTLNWNEYETCVVRADTQRDINLAELKANERPTAKNRLDALMAHVEGNYSVAISKCNGLLRTERQSCWDAAQKVKEIDALEAQSFWGALAN